MVRVRPKPEPRSLEKKSTQKKAASRAKIYRWTGGTLLGEKALRDEVTNEFGQFVEKQRKGLFGAYMCRCLLLGYEM